VLNLRDNFVVARYVKPGALERQLGLLRQFYTVNEYLKAKKHAD
jgi:hypothetical protein